LVCNCGNHPGCFPFSNPLWGYQKSVFYILEHINFKFSATSKFTLLTFYIALTVITISLSLSKLLTFLSKTKLSKSNDPRTSSRLLLVKIAQVGLYVISFFVGLDLLGVDITALTVFGGAIGVGLGFGLQKITSNFISGIILLLEKSTKIGDLIELSDGTTGIVTHTASRYTLLETGQGKEVLIPNEDFITQRMVNWTHSHRRGRAEITLTVTYQSDLDLTKKLILEAATEHPQCLTSPPPLCFLSTLGEIGAVFVLQFWLADIMQGRDLPKSEILFSILNKFKQRGIEIAERYSDRSLPVTTVKL
jgi:small-conductance mechanosensitive channel